LPLQALASRHEMPTITSVWPYHARVIDRTGRILAQTSRWSRLALQGLSLDKRVSLQIRYGDRVRVESFTEEDA